MLELISYKEHLPTLQNLLRRAKKNPGASASTEVINGWLLMLTYQPLDDYAWHLSASLIPDDRQETIEDMIFVGFAVAALGSPAAEPTTTDVTGIYHWFWGSN